ncbi:hypothetical protein IWQ56_004220 [Coemansia nantahalensis]|nr:hypothetical protein IWQ56_004220 [Coemansia nantahalensis]
MPRVLGVQGSPLVIRCSATREVHIFLARDAADAGSWQGALAQVQHALAGGGSVYTSTIASASMSTIGSASTASLVAGAASPPASTASLAPISRRPRSASPLVHRQPPPPSPLPPIPDAQRFAGTVRVRVGGPRATSGGAPAEALCVVVPGSLVGLPSGYSGPMDAEAAIAAAAEFTVDLAHTRLQVLQRPACGSEDPAAAAAGFVFYILRVAAAEDQQAAVALAFDVDDDAACAQWVDALRTVGGIACVAAPAGASEEAPQALRRSQSCVSGLSQADWPMPPATLPVRSSETVPPEFKRARRQTLAQEPQAGDLLALALPSAAQPADDLADASRRPSLDVAAMRLAADGRGDLPRPLPRVSWLRRAVLRSAAASTADPSPQ